jgi:hypothetical protein
MIQYQMEKIRMLENAINIVSINNARTECDEMPARMLTSEYVCMSSASVKKAFAAITARKSASRSVTARRKTSPRQQASTTVCARGRKPLLRSRYFLLPLASPIDTYSRPANSCSPSGIILPNRPASERSSTQAMPTPAP